MIPTPRNNMPYRSRPHESGITIWGVSLEEENAQLTSKLKKAEAVMKRLRRDKARLDFLEKEKATSFTMPSGKWEVGTENHILAGATLRGTIDRSIRKERE